MSTQPAQPNPPSPTHQSEKTVSATADDAHSHNTSIAEKSPNHEQSNPSKAAGDDEYPGSKQVAIGMTAIFLATFLISLDRTIVSTAIPSITDEFNSLDDIGWYGSAFVLTSSCFQLLFGRIYTFNRPKYVFLASIAIFEIGSAVCGSAPSSVAFILGRAIAGVGAAGCQGGNVVLIVSLVPLAKRPFYMGLFGAVMGISAVTGPLIGGVFTTDVSWRWCFYVNLPVGAVSASVILLILKNRDPAQPGLSLKAQLAKLDLLGEFFLLPSIICLLLALQLGGGTYAWSNWRIIVLFVFFGLCFIAFILVQIFMKGTATISGRIIKNRSILSGMWYMVCLSAVMMIFIYYIPVWLQAIKGKSAVQSGIDTLPMVLSLVVASILSGQITGRIGYYAPSMIASVILASIGTGLISTWSVETTSAKWIGYQILFGFGLGIGMQQPIMAAQTVLARPDVPTGIALMFFSQQLSGAIFISAGQAVFDTSLVSGLARAVSGLSPAQIVGTGATDLRHIVPDGDLHAVLVAYNGALRHVFVVAICMACLSCIGAFAIEWRSVKDKQGPTEKKTMEKSAEGDEHV